MTYQIGIELEIQNITVNEVKDSVEEVGASFDGFSGYHGGGFSVPSVAGRRNQAYDATGWRCETDGSLGRDATWDSKGGIEVISKPLSGAAGIRQMKQLTKALKRKGATVDRRCGTHITFGLDNNARFNRMSTAKKQTVSDTVVSIYNHFQPVFDAFSPNNRQVIPTQGTSTNGYCTSASGNSRTSSVNLRKYVMYGVIEFRQPGYTLNGNKIEQWIKILNAVLSASTNENHVSKDMVLEDQPQTVQGMCNYLNIRNTTEDYLTTRITSMATKYTGGRTNRLNVLARTTPASTEEA